MKSINRSIVPTIFVSLLLFLTSFSLFGQGWERSYGASRENLGFGVAETWDNGFLAGGYAIDPGTTSDREQLYVVRVDALGDLVWEKYFGDSIETFIAEMELAKNGDYLFCGQGIDPVSTDIGYHFFRVDGNGSLLWEAHDSVTTVFKKATGITEMVGTGLFFTGFRDGGSGRLQNIVGRIDPQGGVLWTQKLGGIELQGGVDIVPTGPNELVVVGWEESIANNDTNMTFYRVDTNGTVLGTRRIWGQSTLHEIPVDLLALPNGHFLLAARQTNLVSTRYDLYLAELDALGNVIWDTVHGQAAVVERPYALDTLLNGNIVVAGETSQITNLEGDAWYMELDPGGGFIQETTFGGDSTDAALGLIHNANGGATLVGHTRSLGNGNFENLYLLRTDTVGPPGTNLLTGHILFDRDNNLSVSPADSGLGGWLVKIQPGTQQPDYVTTDVDGSFSYRAIPGVNYIVSAEPLNQTWGPLAPFNYVQSFSLPNDTAANLDFLYNQAVNCPLLTVDISAPLIRNNDTTIYGIVYCNQGTVPAQNAYIEVTFDSSISLINSSLPFTLLPGNAFRFDVGTIPVGACDYLRIQVLFDNASYDSQTHCAEAHIYPDSICTPANPGWDGSELEAEAECINNDSVRFKISNVGQGAMGLPGGVIIVEDDIMKMNTTLQLGSGSVQFYDFDADGSIWYLKLTHISPYSSFSEIGVFMEGCGATIPSQITTGYATDIPQNDEAPFLSIDCQEDESQTPFVPNFKSATPAGVGADHSITEFTDLEYLIRFQNPGPGTVQNMIIRDTLSPFLDITSVQPGASSHPYTFAIRPGNILEWSLTNINLPDSSTSFGNSMGFVKFRVSQVAGLPNGTVIHNQAGILMENQTQVLITNQTFHTLEDPDSIYVCNLPNNCDPGFTVLNGILVSNLQPNLNMLNELDPGNQQPILPSIKVYPNPARDVIHVELGQLISSVQLDLYNAKGQRLRSLKFDSTDAFTVWADGLASGLYLYRISTQGKPLKIGRFLKE